jgi:hypothetical protein
MSISTEEFAAAALDWVEGNMSNYSDDAKATVIAALIQSATMVTTPFAVCLEGADRNPVVVNLGG